MTQAPPTLTPAVSRRKPFGFVTKSGRLVRAGLLDSFASKEAVDAVSAQIKAAETGFARDGLVSPPYDPVALAKHLEVNVYHKRAVYTKAQDTAGLGWSLKPRVEDPDEAQKEKIEGFFAKLTPSVETTLVRFMIDRESIGYAAMEMPRVDGAADGAPAGLFHLPSWTLRIHSNEEKFQQRRGVRRRWFKKVDLEADIDRQSGVRKGANSLPAEQRATEILFDIMYSPTNDYYGVPDHIPALGAIHGDIARRDYNIAFFDNYGVPAYAVFITGDFDPGESTTDEADGPTDLEVEIEKHFEEIRAKPHSTLVLSLPSKGDGDVKVTFEKLSVETKEASFRLFRQDNRDEILAAHGVPPYRAGIAEVGALGGSTAKESTEIYKESVINPRQRVIENLMNRHVLPAICGIQPDSNEVCDWDFTLTDLDVSDQRAVEMHEMQLMVHLIECKALQPKAMYEYWAERFSFDPEAEMPADLELEGTDLETALQSIQQRLLIAAAKSGADDDTVAAIENMLAKRMTDVLG